ncbi:hypothetical protein MTO96_026469 [Rhipicephalus appendiculatus]
MSAEDPENTSHIEAETSFEVQLYIYDLSKGLAKTLSPMLIGKQLPGIWHTSIGETILKEPDQILSLGRTELPYSLFLEYIFALGESSYKPHTYDLFRHNCNNFTQEVAVFLTGKSIPQEILDLPDEFLSTPLGGTLQTYFENLSLRGETARGLSFGGGAPTDFIPFSPVDPWDQRTRSSVSPPQQGRQPAPIQRMSSETATEPATEQAARPASDSAAADSNGEIEDRPAPIRKSRRYSDPPVFYPQVDGAAALKELEGHLESVINDQERSGTQRAARIPRYGQWSVGPWIATA